MLWLLDVLQTSMLRMSISPSFKNKVAGEIEGSWPTHMYNLPIKKKKKKRLLASFNSVNTF